MGGHLWPARRPGSATAFTALSSPPCGRWRRSRILPRPHPAQHPDLRADGIFSMGAPSAPNPTRTGRVGIDTLTHRVGTPIPCRPRSRGTYVNGHDRGRKQFRERLAEASGDHRAKLTQRSRQLMVRPSSLCAEWRSPYLYQGESRAAYEQLIQSLVRYII